MTLPRLSTSSWCRHWSISLRSIQKRSGCVLTSQDMRSLMSTNLHPLDSHLLPCRYFYPPVCMLATSPARTSTGVTAHLLMGRAWAPERQPTTLICCTTQMKYLAMFFSHRWNVSINPDVAFVSVGHDN